MPKLKGVIRDCLTYKKGKSGKQRCSIWTKTYRCVDMRKVLNKNYHRCFKYGKGAPKEKPPVEKIDIPSKVQELLKKIRPLGDKAWTVVQLLPLKGVPPPKMWIGKEYATNGRFAFRLNEAPPNIRKRLNTLYDKIPMWRDDPETDADWAKKIKKLIRTLAETAVDPLTPIKGVVIPEKTAYGLPYLFLISDKNVISLSERYFRLFSRLGNIKFYGSGQKTGIIVKKGKKIIGMVMPVRGQQERLDTTELETFRQLLAQRKR